MSDPKAIADLMLYYVEQGCSLTAQYGDYDDPFYTALENNFKRIDDDLVSVVCTS